MVKVQISAGKMHVYCEVNSMLLALLGRLEGRRTWIRSGANTIGITVEDTKHNSSVFSMIKGFDQSLAAARPQIDGFSGPQLKRLFKTEPRPHQIHALDRIGSHTAFALFAEQGTGKTKISIDWAVSLFLAKQITGCLFVSKKGVHRQFVESELADHCALPYAAWRWGDKKQILGKVNAMEFASINYDALKYDGGRRWAADFCTRHTGRLLIIGDESQEIKNVKSGRWKEMNSLKAMSSHRMILTGTPISKDLCDEWSQLMWLDERIIGIKYIVTFRSEFCVMGGFDGRQVVGHKNIQRFKEITAPFVYRVTKDELDLPPKQYKTWKFDLSPAQVKAIKQIRDDVKAGNVLDRSTVASSIMRIQQISNGYLYESDSEAGVDFFSSPEKNPRIEATLDWLDSFEGKAIIWCRFRKDIALLRSVFGTEASYHSGEVSDEERQKGIASFLSPGGVRLLVANPQSAGTGLNLQGLCHDVLYYSNSFNAIDRWQSEDRVHRIGTKGTVTYTDLVATSGIDGHIISNLKRKKGISELALSDLERILDRSLQDAG